MSKRNQGRNKKLYRSLIAQTVSATLAAALTVPTNQLGANRGCNIDRQGPPPEPKVTAHNVATGATRRTKANAEGSYTLVGLPPGTYLVRCRSRHRDRGHADRRLDRHPRSCGWRGHGY